MNIHFVGICGVSMRALAKLAFSRGHTVTGSDNALFGHDAKNVDGKDLVVYTNAVGSDNCELVAARKNHIPTVERAEYLGEISRTFERVIAVAGCHGKSTATAMLGDIFASGASLHVGVKDCSRAGSNKLFITEACEYRKSFLHLTPDIGVILNIKFDHPDYYKTHADLFAAYEQFAERCKTLVVNADDPECAPFLSRAITFGTGGNCDYRAQNIKSECGMRTFTLSGKKRAAVRLGVVGEHNVYNALAAIAAASEAGAPLTKILPALGAFGGIPRRFERVGIAHGKTVFTDYAHHPDEIAASVKCAREIFPSVAVVFQPHTYSRTAALFDRFVTALSLADTVILAPVFAAREQPLPGVSSAALCRAIVQNKERAYCFDSFTQIISACKSLREKAIIFMGAGDINLAATAFVRSDKTLY